MQVWTAQGPLKFSDFMGMMLFSNFDTKQVMLVVHCTAAPNPRACDVPFEMILIEIPELTELWYWGASRIRNNP